MAVFFPPLKIGQEIVAFKVSLSFSLIVELASSVLELLNDKAAEGEKSDLAIITSFSDCSYSNFDIIKFGLLIFEILIALFKSLGISKFKSNLLSKVLNH